MKILILAAFKEELASFILAYPELKKLQVGTRTFLHTKLADLNSKQHDIFVSFTGIGTINSASRTATFCECLAPDCIIMCGTAGGLIPGQKIGDIIVSNKVLDIDLYGLRQALTNTQYEPCLTDPHSNKPHAVEFLSAPEILKLCSKITIPGINIMPGILATSNTFPAPKEAFALIKKLGCAGIEMESAGAIVAANDYDIPVITIRGISNLLTADGKDLGTSEGAIHTCSERLAQYLAILLTKIPELQKALSENANTNKLK